MNKNINLSKASYGDIMGCFYDMAILPWGACEPHNYHLPYITDALLSQAISLDVAECALEKNIKAMVFPPVYLGSQNPGQRDLRFCIHTHYHTQYSILKDIVSSLYSQEMRKLLIINGHGGNSFKNMLRDLAVDFPDFTIAVCDWYSVCGRSEFFDCEGEHADELETSVMMHYYPDLVDLSVAGQGKMTDLKLKPFRKGVIWLPRNWTEISEATGLGHPLISTAEIGTLFDAAVV